MNTYDTIGSLIFNEDVRSHFDQWDDLRDLTQINIFDDLSFDSLEFVQLIIDLEQAFDIEIPDEYLLMDSLSTVEKICQVVNEILLNGSNL